MDFHEFPMSLGKSGVDLIHPLKLCSSLALPEIFGVDVDVQAFYLRRSWEVPLRKAKVCQVH